MTLSYYDVNLQEDAINAEGDVDFKKDKRFSDLLSEKNEAVSDFARKRSMLQQRQYLPIFAVKEQVNILLFTFHLSLNK